MSRSTKIVILVFLVLLLDQALKFWVKTNMTYGEEILMLGLDWAKLHFVENNGMAFGIALGGKIGKLALSIFRILAVSVLIYWIRSLLKAKAPFGFIVSIALILAGAIGNILDSAFYGLLFSDSFHDQVATFLPEDGGYGSFLFGRVVDMFYFPIIDGNFPDWFPFWAGESFVFFRPVFNLADTAITIGVLSILFFHRSAFSNMEELTKEKEIIEAPMPTQSEADQPDTSDAEITDSDSSNPIPKEEDNQA